MNHTIVMGNVGRQPEGLKYTNAGLAVLKFSLADTRGKDEQKKTSWYDVVVFDKQAEAVAEHISKGDRLIVVGRFQVDDYEKKDGTKGKRVELVAEEIGLSIKYKQTSDPAASIARAFPGSTLDEEEF